MSVSACLTLPVSKQSAPRQTGAVLIMALLILSVVAGLAVKFTGEYQLGLARAESRWHGVQAQAYLLGAENLATFLLSEDQNPEVDHPGEPWAQETPPFQIDGGWVLAAVSDARSRLNLNDLGGPLDPERAHNDWRRFSPAQKRFIRLLQTFGEEVPVNQDEAIAVLEAVVDWMDPDNRVSGFGGAEADYYQSLDPGYLPADAEFVSIEELRLVRYITPQLMAALRPHLVVLPPGQGLNVNTLPDRMLAVIGDRERLLPLDQTEVGLLRQDWPEEGFYSDTQGFLSNPAWQSLGLTPETQALTVNTDYFRVDITVSLVEQRRQMRSLLEREDEDFRVRRRSDIY